LRVARARLRLTIQDKNKYNSPKYRLVVRFVRARPRRRRGSAMCAAAQPRVSASRAAAAPPAGCTPPPRRGATRVPVLTRHVAAARRATSA
jgi:hypothetical protein